MDAQQRSHIENRNYSWTAQQPGLAALRQKLLKIGGVEVVLLYESDIHKLLDRGKRWPARALRRPGVPGQCHSNAARLWSDLRQLYSIVVGWALSDDGLWRQHTWLWHRRKRRVIETTVERTRYFGFQLTDIESSNFANNNP